MEKIVGLLNKSFGVYNVKGIEVEPTYWMAGAIVFLLFLLVFTLARLRYLYVHWNLGKSSISMLFWGFLLALILEGFLILSGRTMLTEILGWKNAPKPISTVLDMGRHRMTEVLGVNEQIPSSVASEKPTYQSVIGDYDNLDSNDKDNVRSFICEPK
jgi:phosphoglycerol transferase MdoB-like AlkP superfamily enzyme